jgi:hypothetical protein
MKLNNAVLNDLLAWGQDLPGFESNHAVDALILSQGYVEGLEDDRGLPFFALDLTFIFWMDDRFDCRVKHHTESMDGQAILQPAPPEDCAVLDEARCFHRLRARAAELTDRQDELDLWCSTAEDFLHAWHVEEQLSRHLLQLTYAEYLENGISSTTVPHNMSTFSLLYGLDMPARLRDPAFARLIRDLSIVSRLQNDMFSLERDRREGCQANALLLVERFMKPGDAYRFVEAEVEGYRQMLAQDYVRLGDDDPFVRLSRSMTAALEHWYRYQTGRYQAGGHHAG